MIGFIPWPVSCAEPIAAASRLDAIKSLQLDSIPGPIPAYYSPHARSRAKYLQDLLGGEVSYYEDLFGAHFGSIDMAVLNAQQWVQVSGDEPYGMPSVDGSMPAVFVMPASWIGVTWMVVPRREEVPPAMLAQALSDRAKWDEVKFEGCDAIGAHEIGHFIAKGLGIGPQTKWFGEFVASYIGYAYLKTHAPAQARANDIFWTVGLGKSPHPRTTLDYFERNYDELQEKHPANYGWYQLAFDQRVIELYDQAGVVFIKEIRKEFPLGAPALSNDQLLHKLEAIRPGWKIWAAHLAAGDLKPALQSEASR